MPWYAFAGATLTQKRAAFRAWHDTVCTAEGIPAPGQRQSDNALMVDNCWTDAYAVPFRLADGRLVVNLDPDDPYTAGLTPTVVRAGDGTINGDRGDLEGSVTNPERKSIPRTWDGQTVTRTSDNQEPTRTTERIR